jgi:hypothetical protein
MNITLTPQEKDVLEEEEVGQERGIGGRVSGGGQVLI